MNSVSWLIKQILLLPKSLFYGSRDYWEARYANGGKSGPGSYGRLAEFKAEVLNTFIKEYNVSSVIEFGCGDGNQLSLSSYPFYIGLDVSRSAISLCKKLFQHDSNKSFFLYDCECFVDRHHLFKADVALSIDVIYHLVEDRIFEFYMRDLFSSAEKFVIIYSSDINKRRICPHIKHRQFSQWVLLNLPEWRLLERIPNKYKFESDVSSGSMCDFFIYEKI